MSFEELKAELAHLRDEVLSSLRLSQKQLEKVDLKDAEGERLKAEQIKMFKLYDALEQKSVGQRAIIAELTDALEEECSAQDYHDLVTRAREASKSTTAS